MERITLHSYLRDKAMDRDEDDTDCEAKPSLKFVASKGSPHPSAAKVKPKWITIRRRA